MRWPIGSSSIFVADTLIDEITAKVSQGGLCRGDEYETLTRCLRERVRIWPNPHPFKFHYYHYQETYIYRARESPTPSPLPTPTPTPSPLPHRCQYRYRYYELLVPRPTTPCLGRYNAISKQDEAFSSLSLRDPVRANASKSFRPAMSGKAKTSVYGGIEAKFAYHSSVLS